MPKGLGPAVRKRTTTGRPAFATYTFNHTRTPLPKHYLLLADAPSNAKIFPALPPDTPIKSCFE